MNKIIFNKSSNIFINTGIVAIYRYLLKYDRKHPAFEFSYQLNDSNLVVDAEDVLNLLEEVYYLMGKDIYDTSSKKQEDKLDNVYYDVEKEEFHRFPKMNTYGLASLITNNAQGTTKIKANSPKIKNLEKEQPQIASKIKEYFKKNNLKLLSKVYLNEPYTKITTLDLEVKFWKEGKKKMSIIRRRF
ncbi:MAG: hypothetical protein CMF33_10690 [Leeuwenhoekiella sp.]|nr:hypothetical protein [Leeuwenhoekiella sp.]